MPESSQVFMVDKVRFNPEDGLVPCVNNPRAHPEGQIEILAHLIIIAYRCGEC
ncbi:MAG: hypothetical protein JRI89_12270 [Deltaproteobacteria bacterium]|nr:hypothetical protein [Deltaproteobacteria bacterium]